MLSTISYPLLHKDHWFCHPVKLTAILYLKEALTAENYEECAGIITIAREFGAENTEITEILFQYGHEKKLKLQAVSINVNIETKKG